MQQTTGEMTMDNMEEARVRIREARMSVCVWYPEIAKCSIK